MSIPPPPPLPPPPPSAAKPGDEKNPDALVSEFLEASERGRTARADELRARALAVGVDPSRLVPPAPKPKTPAPKIEAPAPPPPPKEQAPPDLPESEREAAAQAREVERKRQAARKGRSASILTSPTGAEDQLGIINRPSARGAVLLG